MALPALARRLAEGKNFATVATLMADGSPQASVVWLDTDGELLIFNTAEGRIKPRNMRRDPRVAITVHNAENPYQLAMIRGHVVEITAEGADAHVDQMTMKYMGLDEYPYRQPGEQRLIVKVAPDKVAEVDI
jgi:PPOX class probable F420-dependent enzyme